MNNFEDNLRELPTDLDDLLFAYEQLAAAVDSEEEEESIQIIQLWETYKIHPDSQDLKILNYGNWSLSLIHI